MLTFPEHIMKLIAGAKPHHLEDNVDRINSGFTVTILFVLVGLIGSKQHFGSPIQCFTPAESPDPWNKYYNEFCFIQEKIKVRDTGFVYNTSTFEKKCAANYHSKLIYYQWVPYFLLFQLSLFFLPRFMLHVLCREFDGGEAEYALEQASKLGTTKLEDRGKTAVQLAVFVSDIIEYENKRSFLYRYSLIISALAVKWTNVLIVIAQLTMLWKFVDPHNFLWGYNIIFSLITGDDSLNPTAGVFPTVVLCTVNRSAMGTSHNVLMQCVLMVNFINEKAFTFLYFWYQFLLVLNLTSAMQKTLKMFWLPYLIRRSLFFMPISSAIIYSSEDEPNKKPISYDNAALRNHFLNNILRPNGMFLLNEIAFHAGAKATHDLVAEIWQLTFDPHRRTELKALLNKKDDKDKKKKDETADGKDEKRAAAGSEEIEAVDQQADEKTEKIEKETERKEYELAVIKEDDENISESDPQYPLLPKSALE